jgi:prepilin-type N-terminal cleavage/methylation domain-containing protein
VRKRHGFTLLEVMVAVFVLGTVGGALLQLMQEHLWRLAEARQELDAARLAEARLREIQVAAAEGIFPESGREEGEFEPPYDYLEWELYVKRSAVELPGGGAGGPPSSSLFAAPGPGPAPEGAVQSSLLQVELRVLPKGTEKRRLVAPYVMYLVQPLDEGLLTGLLNRLGIHRDREDAED